MISKNILLTLSLFILGLALDITAFDNADFSTVSVHDQLVVDGIAHLRGELNAHEIHVHHDTNTRDLKVRHKGTIKKLKAKKIKSKTLEATNAEIDNLTVYDTAMIANLSFTDAFVDNLAVSNSLSVGGDLSATDILATEFISTCDVIVDCDILMNDTSGLAVGNIFKSGTVFIHNNGTDNTFVGKNSGNISGTLGASNVGVGVNALEVLGSGTQNVAVGFEALVSNVTGSNSTAVGTSALAANTVDGATAVGSFALTANTTGVDNTAVGVNSLTLNTIGSSNTAVGAYGLSSNLMGSGNCAFGVYALENNTSDSNSAFGFYALAANSTGNFNVAVGGQSLASNSTGVENTAVGTSALMASNGNYNTAAGSYALYTLGTDSGDSTNDDNTSVGALSLYNLSAGSNNTAVGCDALKNLTSGGSNIAIGDSAGSDVTAGNLNIYIGNSGDNGEGDGESTTIRIGTLQTDTYIAGIYGVNIGSSLPVLINANGQLGTTSSSRRFKNHIQDIGSASDLLMKLRPVMFNYNSDDSNQINYGFIAEEVAQIYPELVVFDEDGNPYTVKYHLLYALLLNEIQKNHNSISNLENLVPQLLARIAALEQVINSMY